MPRVVLEAEPASGLVVEGPDCDRVAWAARRFFEALRAPAAARIRIQESIPTHVGLGSGTQLLLATGMALARLAGFSLPVERLARIMQRGGRSGIGIGVFARGGFVVDGGVSARANHTGPEVPPLLFHHPFPPDWWCVVAVPAVHQGVSGAAEDRAFADAPLMEAQQVGEICRLLVMQMLPALVERDIRAFGAALTRIQAIVGDYFAGLQGGRFSTPLGAALVARMLESGACGAGQSSWGPAVYGLVDGEITAREMTRRLRETMPRSEEATILCAPAANAGAVCTVTERRPCPS
jgi:beta-RFAP synthase